MSAGSHSVLDINKHSMLLSPSGRLFLQNSSAEVGLLVEETSNKHTMTRNGKGAELCTVLSNVFLM